MTAQSARAARDSEASEEYEPFWPTVRSDDAKPAPSTGSSSLLFALLLVAALLFGTSSKFQSASSGDSGKAGPSTVFANFLNPEASFKYREDFSHGFDGWSGEGSRDGWTRVNGLVKPGKLRLWTTTEKLADYQFEFAGQIEHKGFGWAYRASDLHNYYATKLQITHPGPLPRAELVRYAVVHGAMSAKTRLPLPLVIRTDTIYHVEVNIRGDQFSTLVNGQMVDTWTNAVLKKGGVGLFTDAGENATIHFATVSSRKGALSEFLSYFGFWVPAGWAAAPGFMPVY